ncbi:hypothetical protein GJU41_11740 [Bacillus idriensis]|uniref:HNH nuclease domain-containing protein n=1 Tax=Metabacillus idriensis TaxID=324768 RepID=A0A6I2MBB2_9BACI|nr:HNH endonuclease signature motif containing protein [Metabacillus idriensis]MRX54644.1 hypothetical protein [Metabacillus idriensis]
MCVRFSIEKVRSLFKEKGLTLLEKEYVNSRTKMKYICSCGNISKTTLNNVKRGQKCSECGNVKRADTNRLSIEEARIIFSEHGCYFIDNFYKNVDTPYKYICTCGRISKISISNLKKGHRCKDCGNDRISSTQRTPFEEVFEYFEKEGCELLSKTYKKNSIPLEYRCSCGNISRIAFSSFKQGHRCLSCASERMSGPNNPAYNPNLTDEDRFHRVNNPDARRWTREVKKRDGFKCKNPHCRLTTNKMVAHHLNSYDIHKEGRFDLENGITLCQDCHVSFHRKFGYGKNTKCQYEEWVSCKQTKTDAS